MPPRPVRTPPPPTRRLVPALLLLLAACTFISDADIDAKFGPSDCASTSWFADGDDDGSGSAAYPLDACTAPEGYVADDLDCDDSDGAVNPSATEVCDGVDNDCDGTTDEPDAEGSTTWYADADEDGVGDGDSPTEACTQPDGYVAVSGDCDDHDNDVTVATTTWTDEDGDGFGDDATAVTDCFASADAVSQGGDCDDTDPAFNPGASETDCTDPNDYNCDGSTGYTDTDLDGRPACEDCDDADASVVDPSTWYADRDADGYGDPSDTTHACAAPVGFVADGTDCDDAEPAINPAAVEGDCEDPTDYNCDGSVGYADVDGDGYAACDDCDDEVDATFPGAAEHCNGTDDDCDGSIDEADAVDPGVWYADLDSDGHGDPAATFTACDPPAGYVAAGTDCDDADGDVNPDAAEVCDGIDDDCDGSADEDGASDATTWYTDADGDGYGDASTPISSCSAPDGYVADDTDCDDADAAVNTGADELCNGLDDDCDSDTDEDSAVDATTWYQDSDGDNYGDPAVTTTACELPERYAAVDDDCDDSNATINPGAAETCNSKDDDCDGSTDEGVTTTFYRDADSDGYGKSTTTSSACSAPAGYVADDTDCDDTSSADHPGATETVNNSDDEDCDGVDSCYQDADNDDYGSTTVIDSADLDCADANEATISTDCDDTRSGVWPGATETCTTTYDDDCDGSTNDSGATGCTTRYSDDDGDTYGDSASQCTCSATGSYTATLSTDCDDTDASVHPGATEVTGDGIDEDCDAIEVCYDDDDNDGFLDSTGDTRTSADTDCSDVYEGKNTDPVTDCNDANASINPLALETTPDGVDSNCDGID